MRKYLISSLRPCATLWYDFHNIIVYNTVLYGHDTLNWFHRTISNIFEPFCRDRLRAPSFFLFLKINFDRTVYVNVSDFFKLYIRKVECQLTFSSKYAVFMKIFSVVKCARVEKIFRVIKIMNFIK